MLCGVWLLLCGVDSVVLGGLMLGGRVSLGSLPYLLNPC